ncbi:MAG: hypothetical protein ACYST0_04325, partial [Planctomycetota bacterium]
MTLAKPLPHLLDPVGTRLPTVPIEARITGPAAPHDTVGQRARVGIPPLAKKEDQMKRVSSLLVLGLAPVLTILA